MSPELTRLLITWVLPPVLGAIIGYVTNDIAIRMLFRPLTEKRIFGIRVPLTPGIIPKQRLALAESIGRMVSEHLITEETVRAHLQAKGFKDGLRSSVTSLTRTALEATPAALSDGALQLWRGSLGEMVAGLLGRYLRSQGFFASVRSLVARLVQSLGDRLLSDVTGAEQIKRLARSRLVPLLADGQAARWARGAVERWAARAAAENTPVARLLPAGAIDAVLDGLRAAYPRLSQGLLSLLRGPEARRELETRGRQFLQDVLERLNSLQRFFVSVGQYDRTLDEKMPEIVDDALGRLESFLEQPESVDRFAQTVRSSLDKLSLQGLGDIGADLKVDVGERLAALVERVVAGLDQERLAAAVDAGVDRFFDENGGRTLREVAGRFLGLQEHEIVEAVSNAVLGYVTRPETGSGLADTLEGFVAALMARGQPIGEILGIDDAQKERLDHFLNDRASALLESRLPEFVQGFDIQNMVVDRVNKLDVAQVESLLMIVIAKHLKWINVFGALLGAVIGLIQTVVSLLT